MEAVEDDDDKVVLEKMMQEYRLDMKLIGYLYQHTLKNENLSQMQYAINSLSMNGVSYENRAGHRRLDSELEKIGG